MLQIHVQRNDGVEGSESKVEVDCNGYNNVILETDTNKSTLSIPFASLTPSDE